MLNLTPLRPTDRIVDSVHLALRAAILDGSLKPGQALSVPEFSRQLDVSRSPVREAVLGLVSEGLAIEQPRRGVAVAEIEPADLLEIHEVREGIEAQAARLCAARAGAGILQQLAGVLRKQKAVVQRNDAEGWFQTNADFHRLIAKGAQNRRLSEIILTLEPQMRLGLRQVSLDRGQHRRA
ncbi:MAG TPA: GntR family transcriptional regulator [Bryobacteraceae bacterium]|nr:GntR family transcriptional regulator [Bryobacteraceae bacterium]